MQVINLVQLGTILQVNKNARLSECVDEEYMGNSYFENGARRKSLIALGLDITNASTRVVSEIKFQNRSLRVFSTMTDTVFDAYKVELLKLWAGQNHMEESDYFNLKDLSGNDYKSKYDFWWDIENHVMWGFNKPFFNNLDKIVNNSYTYILGNIKVTKVD